MRRGVLDLEDPDDDYVVRKGPRPQTASLYRPIDPEMVIVTSMNPKENLKQGKWGRESQPPRAQQPLNIDPEDLVDFRELGERERYGEDQDAGITGEKVGPHYVTQTALKTRKALHNGINSDIATPIAVGLAPKTVGSGEHTKKGENRAYRQGKINIEGTRLVDDNQSGVQERDMRKLVSSVRNNDRIIRKENIGTERLRDSESIPEHPKNTNTIRYRNSTMNNVETDGGEQMETQEFLPINAPNLDKRYLAEKELYDSFGIDEPQDILLNLPKITKRTTQKSPIVTLDNVGEYVDETRESVVKRGDRPISKKKEEESGSIAVDDTAKLDIPNRTQRKQVHTTLEGEDRVDEIEELVILPLMNIKTRREIQTDGTTEQDLDYQLRDTQMNEFKKETRRSLLYIQNERNFPTHPVVPSVIQKIPRNRGLLEREGDADVLYEAEDDTRTLVFTELYRKPKIGTTEDRSILIDYNETIEKDPGIRNRRRLEHHTEVETRMPTFDAQGTRVGNELEGRRRRIRKEEDKRDIQGLPSSSDSNHVEVKRRDRKERTRYSQVGGEAIMGDVVDGKREQKKIQNRNHPLKYSESTTSGTNLPADTQQERNGRLPNIRTKTVKPTIIFHNPGEVSEIEDAPVSVVEDRKKKIRTEQQKQSSQIPNTTEDGVINGDKPQRRARRNKETIHPTAIEADRANPTTSQNLSKKARERVPIVPTGQDAKTTTFDRKDKTKPLTHERKSVNEEEIRNIKELTNVETKAMSAGTRIRRAN